MRRLFQHLLLGSFLSGLLVLSGCGKFFSKTTGGGGGCTVNCTTSSFFYVANQNSTSPGIAGFSIAGSALKAVPSSPYPLAVLPTALAIDPIKSFLYVGSSQGQLYLYAIASDGSLTVQNSGNPVASFAAASMQVDSTGSWLLVANSITSSVAVFAINATTGLLTSPSTGGTIPLNGGVGVPSHLVITPDNGTAYVSLGTSGVEVLNFVASTGTLTDAGNLATKAALNSDQGLAVDLNSKFLFVTETGANAVRVLSISAGGHLAEVTGSPFATGQGPSAVLVDATGSYVYVLNRTANSISAYLLTNSGSLTAIAGSPYATGSTPVAIVEDSTKTYVAVVSGGGGPDLQIFKFDSTTPGKLDAFANAATGTDPTAPGAIAASH